MVGCVLLVLNLLGLAAVDVLGVAGDSFGVGDVTTSNEGHDTNSHSDTEENSVTETSILLVLAFSFTGETGVDVLGFQVNVSIIGVISIGRVNRVVRSLGCLVITLVIRACWWCSVNVDRWGNGPYETRAARAGISGHGEC